MTERAVIAGSAWKIGRPFADRFEVAVREAVLEALGVSGLSIGDIDSFVTVASDSIDGIMAPGRAEIAGAYGRSYLHVPSSAGHGLAAAATQIEARQARNLLLVGWGAAAKLNDHDGRANQADPFYARPVGASPRAVAMLQAQDLLSAVGLSEASLDAYVRDMADRAWQGDGKAPPSAAPAWARTAFCDGVAAIVIRRASDAGNGVAIRDFASVSRPYSPKDECLDTAVWAKEAVSSLSGADGDVAVVEASAPTAIAESRAFSGAGVSKNFDSRRFNASGGGATAYFGAATGLRQVAAASRALAGIGPASGLVLDMTGPAGQHATAILLQTGAIR